MRTLVVYYSRTGNTRSLGGAIAHALGADIEEIGSRAHREGFLGYLRSALESVFDRPASIAPLRKDPSDYDLVVVGTPTWDANVSSPIRAFLEQARGRLQEVAFFCTMERRGSERVFQKMGEACGKVPIAKLSVTDETISKARAQEVVRDFVLSLGARFPDIDAAARSASDALHARH